MNTLEGNPFRVSIREHGRRQFEIKSYYPLTSDRTARYRLDIWIYTPANLEIGESTYGLKGFYNDLQSSTRFEAVSIPLSKLIDSDCDISPITRVAREIRSADQSQDLDDSLVLYELRSLTNIYRHATEGARRIVADYLQNGNLALVKSTVKGHLKDIEAFLDLWRKTYDLFLRPTVDPRLREAYRWADESISLSTDRVLDELYADTGDEDEATSIAKRIRRITSAEKQHRLNMGYVVAETATSNEAIERRIYRERILKTWGQSVLHLDQEDSGRRRRMGHFLAATSAAVAMSFAVLAGLAAERFLPGNSLSWALAVVIAYIFKDRIKESLRNILIHTVPGLVSDERIRLVDRGSGRRIGHISGRVRFTRPGRAPASIQRVREAGANPFRAILPEEQLLHYRRDILIRSERLRESHMRLDTLSDEVRLNLDRMLAPMDDSDHAFPQFDEGEPRILRGKRVYHVNFVISRTGSGGRSTEIDRARLVLERKGIK